MIPYNVTPFTGLIDDPSRLKQMQLVKAHLKTIYGGNPD
jgi:acid stress-induced BolA-like protein IbaG/YrbA